MSAYRLELLRYPRWLQAIVLPWLPVVAVLFFFTVTRSDVIACPADASSCTLEAKKGLRTRRDPITDVRVEDDADTKRPVLVVAADGVARYDLHDGVAPAFVSYTESRRTKTAVRIPVGGRAWWWMFGTIVSFEFLLVAYYTFAQRGTALEVERETGRVRILRRARGRTRELTTFDLGDVEELEIEDLDDESMEQAVVLVLKDGKRSRLFDGVNVEAHRGRDFLEEERAAWRSQASSRPEQLGA